MKAHFLICSAALFLPFAGAARAQTPENVAGLSRFEALFTGEPQSEAAGRAMTLDEVERAAMAANPEIAVAERRVAVAEAHVPAAGALDDPAAMYRAWGVPLIKPCDPPRKTQPNEIGDFGTSMQERARAGAEDCPISTPKKMSTDMESHHRSD